VKKYFIISDIHSFYTPMITELHKKGFDENNQNHILVVLGDVFDRGYETLEIFKFLTSLPKERRILIKGNHECLYLELLTKRFPESHDFSNGTVRTFCQISGFDEKILDSHYWLTKSLMENQGKDDVTYEQLSKYDSMPYEMWQQIKEIVAVSDITKWLQSDEWLNYFETKHYICVHSFIPLDLRISYWGMEEVRGYRDDWRNATQTEWEDAMWVCPWRMAKNKWNNTGKTIICGHWHTSDFFNNLTKQRKGKYECPIFKSKRYKLIGLDACTVVSNLVNVLVLNEDEL